MTAPEQDSERQSKGMHASRDAIRQLPKADLHVHLNGAVPTPLAKELLSEIKIHLPEGFSIENDLQVLAPVTSLQEYFKPWLGLKQLPRSRHCLQRMVNGALELLRSDGVMYAEMRNSPFNIAQLNGISMQDTVEWLSEATACAEEQTGVSVRLILSISRYNFDLSRAKSLIQAIGAANCGEYVVGVDLSGNEDSPVSDDVATLLRQAKDSLGLGVTVHAGETGNHRNIEWAIESCKADRIGHALAAVSSPILLERLIEQDICVEVCLHTNLRTGSVSKIQRHPVHEFLRLGVPFVLCSDNPAINAASLSEDYLLFLDATGRHDILCEMAERQRRYAFKRS